MAKSEQRKSAAGVGYQGRSQVGQGRPISGSLPSSSSISGSRSGDAPRGKLSENGSSLFKSAGPQAGQLPQRSDPNDTVGPGRLPLMQQMAPVEGRLQSPESVTPQPMVPPTLPERTPPSEKPVHQGQGQHDNQMQLHTPAMPDMEMPGAYNVDPRRPMIEPPQRPVSWGQHFFRE